MNIVKDHFSIKDLENLSGIKAHTIRIWEKRYGLLSPNRTETNIRYYCIKNLQKLLNITALYNSGYKISKIAKLPEEDIPFLVREIIAKTNSNSHSISEMKMAMMNFDQQLFYTTYNNLLAEKSFREVFFNVFVLLLNDIGVLWQTDTITPAHEHFISHLVKQKILINIERLQQSLPTNSTRSFVLFLPDNEIHEIGLLYMNYEILLRGYKSIYLGQTLPLDSLENVALLEENITFVSYFTTTPATEEVEPYIQNFNTLLNANKNHELWILGQQVKNLELSSEYNNIHIFHDLKEATERL
ncbi:MerR family transcriptional regulator [Galbibacter mesophilus]|uniref:MerR family transcriptional regulator n=1 Tax=Galbibacter mesophilus TaxID=379069 RepID=UPI00191D425B|nr:MerR family transcriptional regulator [Galbibacter mesophilus]MCM5663904.1 MerR family transcriptional regulator [Galbibacter mesophilus]